ncbi:BYPASS-related protein [Tanacetum coccineum]
MLIEMADMMKKAPLGMVENFLVGIDKFLFPSDFVIINRTPNETIILGRPFLATIHAKIHVFNKEISLGIDWYKENSHDNKPRPRDYTFRERMIVKVGHTSVNVSVKKALLKSWVIDCFEKALYPGKDPRERRFDDYKWVFDLEIEQLADEYELRIGKKGHILDMILDNSKNIHGKAKEWWYDYWLEEDERQENREKKYDPPMVYMETFKVPAARRQLSRPTRPVIVLPLEHGISRVLRKDDHSNPSVGTNPVTALCHEVLLGEALEASLARAQRHRQGPSSSLVITEVATSSPDDSSLATTPVTSPQHIVVRRYSDFSSLGYFRQHLFYAEPHDDLFEATNLDR